MTSIIDFAPGVAGEALDLNFHALVTGGTGWKDPFQNGYLRLVQSGSSTLLQLDRDGGGDDWITWVRFANTDAGDLTSHNLDGFVL